MTTPNFNKKSIPELCQKLKCYERGRSGDHSMSEHEAADITYYLQTRQSKWRCGPPSNSDSDIGVALRRSTQAFDSAVALLLYVTLDSYGVLHPEEPCPLCSVCGLKNYNVWAENGQTCDECKKVAK